MIAVASTECTWSFWVCLVLYQPSRPPQWWQDRRVTNHFPSCSAGVGRSGTFITLHTQMDRIADEKNVDVFRFVRSMRLRRCLMVQTEAQYIFIHDALLEALECGMTEVPARELPSQYRQLQTVHEASGKTYLELELQVRVAGEGPRQVFVCI